MAHAPSHPASRSGFGRHGFPPAPKSVRLWPVVGPSREHDELAPADPRRPQTQKHIRVPAWAIQLAVTLAILAVVGAFRLLPLIQSYLAK